MTGALFTTVVISVIGLALVYFLLRRTITEQAKQLRSELQQAVEATNEMSMNRPQARMTSALVEPSPPVVAFDNFTAHESEELDPDTLSAIGASVSTYLGRSVRISPIASISGPAETHHAWAQEGFLAIQNSHELPLARRVGGVDISARRPAVKAATANRNVA